jgi:hypothetical protein
MHTTDIPEHPVLPGAPRSARLFPLLQPSATEPVRLEQRARSADVSTTIRQPATSTAENTYSVQWCSPEIKRSATLVLDKLALRRFRGSLEPGLSQGARAEFSHNTAVVAITWQADCSESRSPCTSSPYQIAGLARVRLPRRRK